MSQLPSTATAGFPLAEFLGLVVVTPTPGRATATLTVDERHANPNGVVHGAVPFAMVDTAMGAAVMSRLDDGRRCASTDVHLRFLRAVTGGRLEATVEVVHLGRRAATLEGRVVTEDGTLVATGTGSFALLPPPS